MPLYLYKAKRDTETVDGRIEADDLDKAISALEEMGYLPVKVEQAVERAGLAAFGAHKVSAHEINIFTRQLATLLKSKVQLVSALEIILREERNPKLREIVAGIRDEVKQGKQLSSTLNRYEKLFSRVYVNMVASGEKSGLLDSVLLRLADFAEKQEEIRSKVLAALAYPSLMLVVGAGTVFVMITFVMPRLTKLFFDMGQSLPLATRILISVSMFSRRYWFWAALAVAIGIFALKKSGFLKKNSELIDRMKLRVPLLRDYIILDEIARFCRTLSLLITDGVPIREAVDSTVPTIGNSVLAKDLGKISADLAGGSSMAKCLAKSGSFPGFVVSLIGVGEESGNLGEALREVADDFEKRLDGRIKVMSSLIEPLMILVIGLVVGFIVVSMLLPIFQISLR